MNPITPVKNVETTLPKLIMLIGLPASGKSTLSETLAQDNQAIIVSSDNYIEAMAKDAGKTYNEVFRENIKGAEKHVKAQVNHAVKEGISIVWDQTNLSEEVRRKRLGFIPSHWEKIAVDVKCGDFDVWKKRLMSRPGKTIPAPVIETMMKTYQKPLEAEGFNEVKEIVT